MSPAPPPVLGPTGDWRGEGDRRDGKGDGDGKRDRALGFWGHLGGPWDSCLNPLVPQRPLGAPRGPPGARRGASGGPRRLPGARQGASRLPAGAPWGPPEGPRTPMPLHP